MSLFSSAPDVIARYFELDADRDIDGITGLFTEDAVVTDERESHHGREAISAWRAGAASRYTYTTEILASDAEDAEHHVVTARLTGDFPGGTVVLRHEFGLSDGRIRRLLIAP